MDSHTVKVDGDEHEEEREAHDLKDAGHGYRNEGVLCIERIQCDRKERTRGGGSAKRQCRVSGDRGKLLKG